jgi:hypothetical protein
MQVHFCVLVPRTHYTGHCTGQNGESGIPVGGEVRVGRGCVSATHTLMVPSEVMIVVGPVGAPRATPYTTAARSLQTPKHPKYILTQKLAQEKTKLNKRPPIAAREARVACSSQPSARRTAVMDSVTYGTLCSASTTGSNQHRRMSHPSSPSGLVYKELWWGDVRVWVGS